MTKLYLVRHGQSLANLQKVFAGHYDIDLSDMGYAQASCIPSYFEGINIDSIYASDLMRAYNTAIPLAKARGMEIKKEPAFREISAGKWETMTFDAIAEEYTVAYTLWRTDIGRAQCPEGESVRQLFDRVLHAFTKIAEGNDGKTVVIATHATPIRVLVSYFATGSLITMKEHDWVKNASITSVSYKDGKFTLDIIGNTDHLNGLLTGLPCNV